MYLGESVTRDNPTAGDGAHLGRIQRADSAFIQWALFGDDHVTTKD